MILRYNALLGLPFLLSLSHFVLFAWAEDFDCKPTLEGNLYDFTSLGNGEHVVNRTRETPPTKTIDVLAFDLCGDLKPKEGVAEQDQCPSGTRVCLTQVNIKDKEPERIISVVPLAQSSKLEAKLTVSPKSPQFLTLLFHGPEYPQPPAESTRSIAQSFELTLWCDPQIASPNITIEGYDGTQLKLSYFGPAGCPQKNENGGGGGGDTKKPDDGKEEESVGSGIGLFFLLLLLAFVAYFAIGAYYNYSTYGARGLDLLPLPPHFFPLSLDPTQEELGEMPSQRPQKYYVVTKGRRPGIYNNWIEAGPHVVGLTSAKHETFPTYAEALEIWEEAQSSGWVQVLGGPPLSQHPSITSSRPLGPSVSLSALEGDRRFLGSFSERTHYVVARGRNPGVYSSWIKASAQVEGLPGVIYQAFNTGDEAWRVYEGARLRVPFDLSKGTSFLNGGKRKSRNNTPSVSSLGLAPMSAPHSVYETEFDPRSPMSKKAVVPLSMNFASMDSYNHSSELNLSADGSQLLDFSDVLPPESSHDDDDDARNLSLSDLSLNQTMRARQPFSLLSRPIPQEPPRSNLEKKSQTSRLLLGSGDDGDDDPDASYGGMQEEGEGDEKEGEVDAEQEELDEEELENARRRAAKHREEKLQNDLFILKKLNAAFETFHGALDEAGSANQLAETDALLNKYIKILHKSEDAARLIFDEGWYGAEADEEQIRLEQLAAEQRAREAARERALAEKREREQREREEQERAAREERERIEQAKKDRLASRGGVRGVRGTRASMRALMDYPRHCRVFDLNAI
ncbi:hypothetical protein MD484_g1855, partial [Candolleomyces efflorescens]